MSLPPQTSISMSHNMPGTPIQEDIFTAVRPPQYNDSNQTGGQSPSSAESTNTTLTAPPDETPEAASASGPDPSPGPRPHIRYYAERDYGNSSQHAVQSLTEDALSAYNNDRTAPWGELSFALSQFVMDSNTSVRRVPQTHTVARTGTASSRTMGAHQADPVPQTDDMTNSIRAVGWQFDDVPACPTGLILRHEDCQ
ncbi:hypothetical protein F5X97DRAFT_65713 [Nemania serpens]|nr:hypothetical protein F5X97DRAFT_65713 [Nemania serpens]